MIMPKKLAVMMKVRTMKVRITTMMMRCVAVMHEVSLRIWPVPSPPLLSVPHSSAGEKPLSWCFHRKAEWLMETRSLPTKEKKPPFLWQRASAEWLI